MASLVYIVHSTVKILFHFHVSKPVQNFFLSQHFPAAANFLKVQEQMLWIISLFTAMLLTDFIGNVIYVTDKISMVYLVLVIFH